MTVRVDELDVVFSVQITNGQCVSQVRSSASWPQDKIVKSRDWYTFSAKGHIVNILDFIGQMMISHNLKV